MSVIFLYEELKVIAALVKTPRSSRTCRLQKLARMRMISGYRKKHFNFATSHAPHLRQSRLRLDWTPLTLKSEGDCFD